MDYAWDEPALPHKLVLELPGYKKLGEFDLDRVNSQSLFPLKATPHRPEQSIQVCVRADGPKRVLQLIDLLVRHSITQTYPALLLCTGVQESTQAT